MFLLQARPCKKYSARSVTMVTVTEPKQNKLHLPTMYWLPKLHNKPYKARLNANSSSCTTTELSKLSTSCHVIRYCKKFMKGQVKE